MTDKIGVGIITYNRPDYFEQCISKMPWDKIDECIVVKDGGGEYYNVAESDNFHYHEYAENGGNCRSKNKAFEYRVKDALRAHYRDANLIEFIRYDRTGAAYEHAGFGKYASEAKNRQLAFFERCLGSA